MQSGVYMLIYWFTSVQYILINIRGIFTFLLQIPSSVTYSMPLMRQLYNALLMCVTGSNGDLRPLRLMASGRYARTALSLKRREIMIPNDEQHLLNLISKWLKVIFLHLKFNWKFKLQDPQAWWHFWWHIICSLTKFKTLTKNQMWFGSKNQSLHCLFCVPYFWIKITLKISQVLLAKCNSIEDLEFGLGHICLNLTWVWECGGQTWPEPDKHIILHVWTLPELDAVHFLLWFSSWSNIATSSFEFLIAL